MQLSWNLDLSCPRILHVSGHYREVNGGNNESKDSSSAKFSFLLFI